MTFKRAAAFLVLMAMLVGCGSKLTPTELSAADRLAGAGGGSGGNAGGTLAAGATPTESAQDATSGAETSGAAATAEGSTASPSAAAPAGGNGGSTDVGVTATSIKLGLVTTLTGPVPGVFRGAAIGARACVAKINSQGGIYGRKLDLEVADDQFNQNQLRAQIERLGPNVFSFVGTFSQADGVVAEPTQRMGVPDIGMSIEAARFNSKMNFSPSPQPPGYFTGGLAWVGQQHKEGVQKAGFLGVTEARPSGEAIAGAMSEVGYNVVYKDFVSAVSSDFTAQVFRMKTAGVRALVMMAEAAGYAQFLRAAEQQGLKLEVYYPISNAYDQRFLKLAGPLAEGAIISHPYAMYGGEDAPAIPEVAEFNSWYKKIDSSATIDTMALFGWTSCKLFAQAANAAGPKLTRTALLTELGKITKFDAGGMLSVSNPAGKQPGTCYVVFTVKDGRFQRLDPASGLRCDGGFYRL